MARIDGIDVYGSPAFRYRTRQALELLSASQTFHDVRPFLAAIKEGRRSGMWVYGRKPTFYVGKKTWQAPILWYASSIVHDANHSRLYRLGRRKMFGLIPFTPATTFAGKDAERRCLEVQLRALREIGADDSTLEYISCLMLNPTYHERWFVTW